MNDRIDCISPMRDEAEKIEGFVSDVAAQDWACEVEVVVADGGSPDGSVERLFERAPAWRDRRRPCARRELGKQRKARGTELVFAQWG